MKAATLLLLLVGAVVAYVLSPALFFILLLVGFLFAVGYYKREKCPSCGSRGTIALDRSDVIGKKKAYGIVTRTDTTTSRVPDGQGKMISQESTTERQERVPVVKTTSQDYYKCSKCGYSYSKESVDEEEDFSRDEEPREREKIVEREVVKVRCKYCGTMADPVRNETCPKCGAKLL